VIELDRFLPGIFGAIVGVIEARMRGYTETLFGRRRPIPELSNSNFRIRQAGERQAMNAGRAVYFELLINRMNVVVARDYGSFLPLGRSSFDRLLPELATWLPAEPLQTVVGAYMGHAGYESAHAQDDAPPEMRRAALDALEAAHRSALDAIRPRLFNHREIASLTRGGGPYALSVPTPRTPEAGRR